jgi:NADPH2:quinone reductase
VVALPGIGVRERDGIFIADEHRGEPMKAIRVHEFGGPEVLRLEEVPTPKPGHRQVVVRLHAAGENPVETYISAGMYSRKPALPYIPGSDGAGVVESVGEGLTHLHLGDRVYTTGSLTGTYAEFALSEAAQVHPLPPSITFAQGACLFIPYYTAYRALFHRAVAQPGEVVLIHGASGGVGIAAVQLARAVGMTVIGSAGTERGRALVREQGAHHVVDHTASDSTKDVAALTGGRGVDVILEMLANANLGKDLSMLAPKGRVVVIGSRGPVEIDPRETMSRDASIIGMLVFNATPAEMIQIDAALHAAMENGTVRPVVGAEMPLAEARHAHERIMSGGATGKIVLIP